MTARVQYQPRTCRRTPQYMQAVAWYRGLDERRRLEVVRKVGRAMPRIVGYYLRGGR